MNIAVTADGPTIESSVSCGFENCAYLLIVDADDMSLKVIRNDVADTSLAEAILKHDCEAVITGSIEATAFDILADAFITRYSGYGNKVSEVLHLMEKNQLDIIRNAEGKEGCGGRHQSS